MEGENMLFENKIAVVTGAGGTLCSAIAIDLAKKGGKVHVIGDAASVGNLRTVIWGAWDTCMKI